MKKMLALLTALIMILFCAACLAEGEPALTVEEAKALYEEYLGRILNREEGFSYGVGTVEYGLLDPLDVDPAEYAEGLKKAELTAADITEAPEGEYVFLNVPDQIQFDFFQGEAEKNYVRVIRFGEPEKSILLKAVFPDDFSMTISGLVQMWANELANVNGIPMEDEEAAAPLPVPEAGWFRDSVEGAVWMDDRASLEVIPEGDGYKVLILWASSAWETTEWTYACEYEPEEDRLVAISMICDDVVYDENGNETRTTVADQECETVFAPNENGELVITNAADEQLEGKAFTMIRIETEEAGLHADIQLVTESPEWVAKLPAAQDAEQLFVVAGIGMDKTTAYISMHYRDENGTWKQILPPPASSARTACARMRTTRKAVPRRLSAYIISTRRSASLPIPAAPFPISGWTTIPTGPETPTGSITRWWISATCRNWSWTTASTLWTMNTSISTA